jgi:uncharacterized heparinase superfamily protein
MNCTIDNPCDDCVALDKFLEARDTFVRHFKEVTRDIRDFEKRLRMTGVIGDMNEAIDTVQNCIDAHITGEDST